MAISSGTLTIIVLSAVLLLVVVIYIIIFMQMRKVHGALWKDEPVDHVAIAHDEAEKFLKDANERYNADRTARDMRYRILDANKRNVFRNL